MYRKQMKFQKLFCVIALVASVVVFIYSLGIMTDLFDCLYSTMMDPTDIDSTWVSGSQVYYYMQGFNRSFLSYSIVLLLLACLLFITNTDKRRRYYIANYVSVGLYSACALYIVFWGHSQIQYYKALWKQVNFEELKDFAETFNSAYTESTFWFDIHYLVFGILLVAVGLLVYNVIWKNSLMKEEAKVIAKGKEEA
ncbi:MAG: hypothetical protein K6F82_05185 [Sphaerochaetaceae bacterium]|nr:hypothetical protein [Sphaerochaetaceae bacterium]